MRIVDYSTSSVRYLLALALVALPAAAACQTGSGTVIVVDRDRIEVRVEPETFSGFRGDTVTFRATAVDTVTGDTIPAIMRWRSGDDDGVAIDPTSGHAELLEAGTYQVFADLVNLVGLAIFQRLDDGWREVDRLEIAGPDCVAWNDDGIVDETGTAWETPPTCAERDPAGGERVTLCALGRDEAGTLWTLPDVEWSSGDPSIVSVESGGGSCAAPDILRTFPGIQEVYAPVERRRVG